MRRILLAVAVGLTALVPVASATAHTTTVRLTPAAAAKLIGTIHTQAEGVRLLKRLSPANRRLVVSLLTPTKYVYKVTTHVSPSLSKMDATAESGCVSFSKSKNIVIQAYGNFGLVHLFDYHTDWQWSGQCWVHAASHQEWGTAIAPGWQFERSTYGQAYGGLNTPMIGRETFGYFDFLWKVGEQDTVQSQVKVYGGWGQFPYGEWNWDNIY